MNGPRQDTNGSSQRDADVLRLLAWFFVALATLVLIGTLWALDDVRAIVVNLSCGLVLGAVGSGMLYFSRRIESVRLASEASKSFPPPSEDE